MRSVTDREFFKIDYTFWLNITFLVLTAGFFAWKIMSKGIELTTGAGIAETVLFYLAMFAYLWLAGGLVVGWIGAG